MLDVLEMYHMVVQNKETAHTHPTHIHTPYTHTHTHICRIYNRVQSTLLHHVLGTPAAFDRILARMAVQYTPY